MSKGKIIINDDEIMIQDLDKELEDGDEVEVQIGDNIVKKKIKKTELLKTDTVIRIFRHSGNSYEFGKAGNRHKIHYYSESDAIKKIKTALRIEGIIAGTDKEIKLEDM